MVSAFGLTSLKKETNQLVQKTSSKQLASHLANGLSPEKI